MAPYPRVVSLTLPSLSTVPETVMKPRSELYIPLGILYGWVVDDSLPPTLSNSGACFCAGTAPVKRGEVRWGRGGGRLGRV